MLEKQVVTIGLSGGLDNKTDEKLIGADKSLYLENARFYKTGRLSKRYGLSALTNVSSDGVLNNGTISNLIADDKQISAITDQGIYSLYNNGSIWEKVSSYSGSFALSTKFSNRGGKDCYYTDCDYDETSGLMVVASLQTGNTSPYIGLSIEDETSGTKKTLKVATGAFVSPLRVIIAANGGDPRVILFYSDGTSLLKAVYDKELVQIGSSAVVLTLAATDGFQIAAVKDSNNVFLAYIRTTNLSIYKYSHAGASVSNNTITALPAITLRGTIAEGLGLCENGTLLHIAYPNNSETIFLGVSKSALTESITRTSIVLQSSVVALCANSTHVYASVSYYDAAPTDFVSTFAKIEYNTTYTAISGFSSRRLSVLSAPFFYNGVPYAIVNCNEDHQQTGLIIDMDAKPVAKISPLQISTSSAISTATNENYLVSKTYYSDDRIITAFDRLFSSTATVDIGEYISTRGASVCKITKPPQYKTGTKTKIGESFYFTNGLTIEIDQMNPHENGFILSPIIKSATASATGGSMATGTYSYVAIYEYYDGKGQVTRSTPCPLKDAAVTGPTGKVTIDYRLPVATFKGETSGSGTTGNNVTSSTVIYRTKAGSSTFYRLTAIANYSTLGTSNSYIDTAADSAIGNNEILYTTGNVLENDSAPIGTFSWAGGNRLMIGGLEQADEIAFSKKQLYGQSVAFNDSSRIRVASGTAADKSPLSAGGYMDGKHVIFRSNSIYYVAGDGPLDTGADDRFTEPELISSDTGCDSPKSVLLTPNGLMFKSRKGIYLLDRSFQVSYVGSGVEDYNDENIVSSILHEKFNEARFYTDAGNCLVYNYLFNQWSVFIDQTSVDADNWQNEPVSIVSNQVFKETEGVFTDAGTAYRMLGKTPWIKLSGLQDFGRIWSAIILGTYKSSHSLQVNVYYDYATDYVETFTINPQASDSQYQYRIHLKKQKCEAIQFEILDLAPTGESMDLSAITLEVGLRKGSMKLAASRKY